MIIVDLHHTVDCIPAIFNTDDVVVVVTKSNAISSNDTLLEHYKVTDNVVLCPFESSYISDSACSIHFLLGMAMLQPQLQKIYIVSNMWSFGGNVFFTRERVIKVPTWAILEKILSATPDS